MYLHIWLTHKVGQSWRQKQMTTEIMNELEQIALEEREAEGIVLPEDDEDAGKEDEDVLVADAD